MSGVNSDILLYPCLQEKLDVIRTKQDSLLPPDPEDKCGKVLELAEDLLKKSNICKSLEDKETF